MSRQVLAAVCLGGAASLLVVAGPAVRPAGTGNGVDRVPGIR